MPKTKARKRGAQSTQPQGKQETGQVSQQGAIPRPRASRSAARGSVVASRMDALQGLLMPTFVALGCFGLAVSFIFFFPDPNHVLYGGMAAAMGIIWSIIIGLRIARVVRMSREGRIYK